MTSTCACATVLLVDDHAVVREGYRRLLERSPDIRIVGEAGTAADAYREFCSSAPDVVVMDLSLPDVSGIEATRRILSRDAHARILVFSIHDEAVYANRAFRSGARGFVTKASAPEVLIEAVQAIARGEIYLSPDIAQTLAVRGVTRQVDLFAALSNREFEIVRLLANGHSVREIAERLCLTAKTIANYQTGIRQKLGAATPVELVRMALREGLIADRVTRPA